MHLRNISLKTKLLLIYFLTIFLPLAVVGQVIIGISGNKIVSQSMEINRTSAEQTAQNIKDLLKQNLNIVNRICLDQRLVDYLDIYSTYSGEENWVAYLNYLNPLSTYITNIVQSTLRIYYLNETLVQDNRMYIYATEKEKSLDIYKLAINKAFLPVWCLGGKSVFLGRAMNGNNYEVIAVATVEIPEDIIYSFIKKSEVNEKIIIICDDEGNVISSNDRTLPGTSVKKEPYFSEQAGANQKDFKYKALGNFRVINHSLAEDKSLPGWRIITLVSVDKLLADSRRNSNMGLFISALCLLVSTVLFIIFLDRITNRIQRLVRKMQKVKEGDFQVVDEKGPEDEIGIMISNFNLMVGSLQTLIYENYETKLQVKDVKIKKREAELYALQSQINPHFLFNALESIRLGMFTADIHRTAGAVLNLSRLLRKSLNWGGEMINLSEEIDLVRNYLDIQTYRYSDKITYNIYVAEELGVYKIPKLIIQPFVENAVIHGLEKKWGKGRIDVTAVPSGGRILITVSDDGLGMEPETLERIRKDVAEGDEIKKEGSIGIKNVSDRLRLHFGQNCRIMIDSRVGEGTSITVEIPSI